MKVLLIQPPSTSPLRDKVFLFEPLALEYIGAGLELDGHEVALLDARIDPGIEEAFRIFRPDVVGITGFTSHVNIIKGIARRLKNIDPTILFVVGGHHATVCPSDFNDPSIDVVVIGEGVFTMREILNAWESGRDFISIRGVAVPGTGNMRFSSPRPYTNLDDLPFPDRSLSARYRHLYHSEWFNPLASVRTSLGCTARCDFCSLWKITGGKYLRRHPESVVKEIIEVDEPYVFFCDDESMLDTRRMNTLADLIREQNIHKRFFLYARVDTIVDHPDLFAKWAEIGLAQVFVGMEEFTDERLETMGKGITIRQQEEAVRILDRLGIMMEASYIVDPSYTHDDFNALLKHVRKMGHKYLIFTVMTPLPGTRLYDLWEDRLITRKPELFDLLHAVVPTTLPLEEFYKEFANLYRKALRLSRIAHMAWHLGFFGLTLYIRVFRDILHEFRNMYKDY